MFWCPHSWNHSTATDQARAQFECVSLNLNWGRRDEIEMGTFLDSVRKSCAFFQVFIFLEGGNPLLNFYETFNCFKYNCSALKADLLLFFHFTCTHVTDESLHKPLSSSPGVATRWQQDVPDVTFPRGPLQCHLLYLQYGSLFQSRSWREGEIKTFLLGRITGFLPWVLNQLTIAALNIVILL